MSDIGPVLILAGGLSPEREVSLRSGQPYALRFLGQTPSWEHPGGFDGGELSVEIGENDSLIPDFYHDHGISQASRR